MNQIALNFGRASETYDRFASVQRATAQNLLSLIPEGEIAKATQALDVGTGTGYMAQLVRDKNPALHLTLNDLSPAMLTMASQRFHTPGSVSQHSGNAEKCAFPLSQYDLVTGNMVALWFEDWRRGICHLRNHGRVLALSIPVKRTFREWEEAHAQIGIASSLRNCPTPQQVEAYVRSLNFRELIVDQQSYALTFPTPQDFVKYLRGIGAQTPAAAPSPNSLRRVLKSLHSPLTLSYEIFYIVLKGDS